MGHKNRERKDPHWALSLIPFAFLIAILAIVVGIFGADALSGPSQIALLSASAVAALIATLFCNVGWEDIEKAVLGNIGSTGSALVLLLLIGAVSGSWMISGVVPTLICYGLQCIHPSVFLFATCIICAIVSVVTGSSWTTIATIGLAFLGIGTAQGFSPGWTVGAIISGAYFGDKISPLSDTTILASSTAGTSLHRHIRYMLVTTIPSFTIALCVFLAVSLTHKTGDLSAVQEFSEGLRATFHISPMLLLVPILTGIMIARRVPAIATLFFAALIAGIAALAVQPHAIWSVANDMAPVSAFPGSLSFAEGFEGIFGAWYGETRLSSGNEALDNLISTRGMRGMLDTVFLILCSLSFGGVMIGSGMLHSITTVMMRFISRTTSAVAATVGTGIFCNLATGDQYISIILTGNFYKPLYERLGLEKRLLSRSMEDSATVTSVLIPWNSCGMTQSTVLKVATMDYLPYCIFNLLSPVMSIIIAAAGYKIIRKTEQ